MNLLTGISLITAFVGGMVALFAPCCITFLLPSYLGAIFKEKRTVLLMTLIFGLGIATILVPTALGIRIIGEAFLRFHTQTYIIAGVFMILLGAMELTGKKITLPMIHKTIDIHAHHDPFSVYLLGVFSGITSSCCTPVLAGILTLSFVSPTFFMAALAGIFYVAGMVTPLVLLSLFLEKINWASLPQLRGKTIGLAGKQILLTDAIAGTLFIIVGMTFSILALSGRIQMGSQTTIEQTFAPWLLGIIRQIRTIPGAEIIFAVIVIVIFIILINSIRKKEKKL